MSRAGGNWCGKGASKWVGCGDKSFTNYGVTALFKQLDEAKKAKEVLKGLQLPFQGYEEVGFEGKRGGRMSVEDIRFETWARAPAIAIRLCLEPNDQQLRSRGLLNEPPLFLSTR